MDNVGLITGQWEGTSDHIAVTGIIRTARMDAERYERRISKARRKLLEVREKAERHYDAVLPDLLQKINQTSSFQAMNEVYELFSREVVAPFIPMGRRIKSRNARAF